MNDQEKALAALLHDMWEDWAASDDRPEDFDAYMAARLYASGVRAAPSPDAPGLRGALVERVVHAAFDVDGAWDAEDTDGAPILWHAEAGEVLADLRAAIEALDDDQPWYSVLRDADTPIRTVTTPDGQVYRPDCGAHHPEHPGTRCRQPEGHSGEHATARLDVTWDNAYLSAPEGK